MLHGFKSCNESDFVEEGETNDAPFRTTKYLTQLIWRKSGPMFDGYRLFSDIGRQRFGEMSSQYDIDAISAKIPVDALRVLIQGEVSFMNLPRKEKWLASPSDWMCVASGPAYISIRKECVVRLAHAISEYSGLHFNAGFTVDDDFAVSGQFLSRKSQPRKMECEELTWLLHLSGVKLVFVAKFGMKCKPKHMEFYNRFFSNLRIPCILDVGYNSMREGQISYKLRKTM